MKRIILLSLVLLSCGCVARWTERPVGSVEMKKDGTLAFHLRAETDGAIGDSYFEVNPTDTNYPTYLEHVSPIYPGEDKPVRPWKD
jgi:hypothetical protein